MKLLRRTFFRFAPLMAVLLLTVGVTVQAQGTAFTYQGKLNDNGAPASGTYDFQFKLFDALTAGNQMGSTNSPTNVAVSGGVFSVPLDFGAAAFPGANRWLEISARLAGSGAFTTLSPRQPITSTPYAIKSLNATAADGLSANCNACVTSTQIGSLPANNSSYIQNTTSQQANSSFNISGNGIIGGNAGVGTLNPLARLHASSNSAASTSFMLENIAGTASRQLILSNYGSMGAGLFWPGLDSANTSSLLGPNLFVLRATGGLAFSGSNTAEHMRIAPSGNIGIGQVPTTAKLTVTNESGDALSAYSTTSGIAVFGYSQNDNGVYGYSNSNSASSANRNGVYGYAGGHGAGVFGQNNSDGWGVYGYAANTSGQAIGIQGVSDSTAGIAVRGVATTTTGTTYGTLGISLSSSGIGAYGIGSSTAGANYGVFGYSNSGSGTGVYGSAQPGGTGVKGELNGVGAAIIAVNSANSGFADGIRVTNSSIDAVGILAKNTAFGGTAGRFDGNVAVNGILSKSAGSFKIDHPLDPENKYLSHSFVESPDMMNLYNGVVSLDDRGEAEVVMPEWFEALNQDFRYQLTCIGGFAPVYIAAKIKNNRFRIAGGQPGLEVSWQVTGVRHDVYADKHRIPVEELKSASERGFYLHPAEFGQPEEKGILWGQRPEQMKREREAREQLLREQALPGSKTPPTPKP